MSHDRPLLVFFTSRRSGPARRMESLLAHIARRFFFGVGLAHANFDSAEHDARVF